jgi:hypothetical protein
MRSGGWIQKAYRPMTSKVLRRVRQQHIDCLGHVPRAERWLLMGARGACLARLLRAAAAVVVWRRQGWLELGDD